ncbi:hypothetical protein A3J41_02995 [candidate division TM6 bacterium RIFCSPHIGHO2_12_FULL_38_8]|nr:MAG: hypothetical protein A3J41_02995 [candidate division TM6 bacterium RIFCSPHIGHO2_12_FULL_38_8]
MFICITLLVATFFFTWSMILRQTAAFLLKDCIDRWSVPLFSIFDFFTTIFWLFTAYKIHNFLPAYFLFFSALWITIHTDLKHMLISRFVTLYLIPIAIFLAYTNFLPISWLESALTAIVSYLLFWMINKIFYFAKGYDGLGQGDFELIAMISAFTGMLGCWFTILCASLTGMMISVSYMLCAQKFIRILPFGPFLAFGAATFVLYQSEILEFLTRYSS